MIAECSYSLNSEIFLSPGIWISFFGTEEVHAVMRAYVTDRYPVIPIFSSRYLLALEDVVTEVVFKLPKRRLLGLPRCKPHLCAHCGTSWNSF
jgi:hypothetical protein